MEDKVVPDWRKSSYSGNGGGNCVEVGADSHAIAVRDTKQKGVGPVLRFSPTAWRRFAGQLRRSLALTTGLVCERRRHNRGRLAGHVAASAPVGGRAVRAARAGHIRLACAVR